LFFSFFSSHSNFVAVRFILKNNLQLTVQAVTYEAGGRGGRPPPRIEKFRANSIFRASTSCSNTLNVKTIFNAVKNFREKSVFSASASSSKIVKDKKYFNGVKIFKASASCSKV